MSFILINFNFELVRDTKWQLLRKQFSPIHDFPSSFIFLPSLLPSFPPSVAVYFLFFFLFIPSFLCSFLLLLHFLCCFLGALVEGRKHRLTKARELINLSQSQSSCHCDIISSFCSGSSRRGSFLPRPPPVRLPSPHKVAGRPSSTRRMGSHHYCSGPSDWLSLWQCHLRGGA